MFRIWLLITSGVEPSNRTRSFIRKSQAINSSSSSSTNLSNHSPQIRSLASPFRTPPNSNPIPIHLPVPVPIHPIHHPVPHSLPFILTQTGHPPPQPPTKSLPRLLPHLGILLFRPRQRLIWQENSFINRNRQTPMPTPQHHRDEDQLAARVPRPTEGVCVPWDACGYAHAAVC
jgi:hypothetical protein